jgi:hypothetical protein
MKNKTNLLLVFAIAMAVALVSSVSAQETAVAKSDKAIEAQAKNKNVVATDDTTQTTDATATEEKGKKDKKENKGQVNAESHRSTVATFVQSLLAVADREGGIGQQVKVIAQQQNDSKEKVAESIDKVEKRGKVKTFFFGSDYKNLGDLRSEMVKTKNQIEQLKRLADKAENETDKTELQNQIKTLEQEQTNINSFITTNESKFSLFGWAVKLFQ